MQDQQSSKDETARREHWFGLELSYGRKLFLLATLPLILAVAAISTLVVYQARALSEQEIQLLEDKLLEAKQAELVNYMSLARTSISHIYGRAAPDDETAKTRVTQVLSAMNYGNDGFFFVYDYEGNNLVSPKQTYLIGKNWIEAEDRNGDPVVQNLIAAARQGGGYHRYLWPKPSTGETAEMYSYVVGLQDWRWAVGTGIWIDDVIRDVAAARADTEERIARTFRWIVAITLIALLSVFISGLLINTRERRLADAKLKALTQRVFDTQEEERGRVARELHDGISQILVGVRYALDITARRLKTGKGGISDGIEKGTEGLNTAIQEVRRISRDLRPGVLDDLGLGPALKALTDEFKVRTGIRTRFETVVFRNRMTNDAKIALYRVAQEALTNIERHAEATEVSLKLFGHRHGATMRIEDNGKGIPLRHQRKTRGLGMRNMSERVEHLNGTLRVLSSPGSTVVEATLPIRHLLSAEKSEPPEKETA